MNEQKLSVIIKEFRDTLFKKYDVGRLKDDDLDDYIDELIEEKEWDEYLTLDERKEINRRVFASIRGLGLLDSIMKDDDITEIMVNGPDNIFIEKKGNLIKLNQHFEDDEQLLNIINRIVENTGREVGQANPIVDTRLENGSRVNVVLSPISRFGTALTIRKFSKDPMTIDMLLQYGSITPEVARVLELLVKARYNIFISGGTGSGKTTFLNAISNYIPSDERVITIEDSAELQIEGVDNLISLETRNKNSVGVGEISIRDLIKSSLRMRPERIIVGEVRGAEALDMLQAMNTGHDGSLSTGHANSAKDMMLRLETMVLQGADKMPLEAIRAQIASAIDIVIHLSRLRDKTRKTMEISEVIGYKDGEVQLNTLYKFVEDTEKSNFKKVYGTLQRTDNKMINVHKLRLYGFKEEI